MKFKTLNGTEFTIQQMVNEIENYIKLDQDYVYDLIVGSDSLYKAKETVFSTAVIIHKVGNGARFFYNKRTIDHDIDICTRILQETYDSIEVMREIEKTDLIYSLNDYSIHIDAGENGDSRKIIKECMAYVKGFGYPCKVKPESFGASRVADRQTK